MAPANKGEDPFSSKRVYVKSRLVRLRVDQLHEIARQVAYELGDDALAGQLEGRGLRGVSGDLRNIIFASIGPKPRIVMTDAINNIIDVVDNQESCLIYDRPLTRPGLTWGELTEWWGSRTGAAASTDVARDLYHRLSQSLESPPEKIAFRTYCERYGGERGNEIPALLPQVYLHYDPYTRAERLESVGELKRERMDFFSCLCPIAPESCLRWTANTTTPIITAKHPPANTQK